MESKESLADKHAKRGPCHRSAQAFSSFPTPSHPYFTLSHVTSAPDFKALARLLGFSCNLHSSENDQNMQLFLP